MGRSITKSLAVCGFMRLVTAIGCPFADPGALRARDTASSDDYLAQFEVDDSTGYMTDDVGGQIADQNSLKAGSRGPTLLEDYIFRQKYIFS